MGTVSVAVEALVELSTGNWNGRYVEYLCLPRVQRTQTSPETRSSTSSFALRSASLVTGAAYFGLT